MSNLIDKNGQIPLYDPDDSPSMRRTRTILSVLAITCIIAIWACVIRAQLNSRARGHGASHIAKLREEFANISPPVGASPLHELTIRSKVGGAFVSNRYSASGLSPTLVLNEYGQRLSGNGWVSIGRNPTGSSVQERFCKGPYEATLDVHAERQLYYEFSMAWNELSVRSCTPS